MAHEKIVTLFDSVTQADAAKRNLMKAGFADRDISLISGERLQSEGKAIRHPSIWQRLFGHTVDEDQADVYTKAMDTGGVVLTLQAEEEELAKAMTILHSHDSVDVPSRIKSSLTDTPQQNVGQTVNPTAGRDFAGETDDRSREPLRTSLTGDESEEEILRLAEEQIEVGKRLVSEGSTRVRRYTVTDEVSEDISLHEQHADIFRRSINEPALTGDVDWSEKTVEVAESHEQPVVNKTANVKEEVVVRTDGSDRTETINDSVRRQEVDIDKNTADSHERALSPAGGANTVNSPGASPAAAVSAKDENTTGNAFNSQTGEHKPGLTEKAEDKLSAAKDKLGSKL
ncbi:YsnF/AvaK domain-containing protein [Mixta mediterraneensis]|uniref:YsnF/AvaK domain-containing protein n=1 Tax=Mixta mediterraneensis TaxID=2758443 RepID=UPI0018769892|nr:YsnF/AvaK domain-containing protein [Mixta mediterraneensis]MBE5254084.1 YsnF/AvaK domain-containing protein [Mixta mediterraneensis]